MKRIKSKVNYGKLVDYLGQLRARVKDLEQEQEEIKAQLIESGKHEIEGEWFRAVVCIQELTVVDYRAIVEKLRPSLKLIETNTKMVDRVQVKVTAR